MTDKGLPHIADSCVLIDYTSVFTLAKHEGYICWTNDSKLKEIREEAGITASWGFEMMLVLCANGHLDQDTALSTARGICLINRYIADKVLADFETKIEDIFG